jgi:DNA-binding MarR family transcriptional regulator
MLPLDFNGLDGAIHGPIRLGVMTALQMDGTQDFTTLKTRLMVHGGSLNLHLRTLEEAGYIRSCKAIVGLRPKTTYSMTGAGRTALAKYAQAMSALAAALTPAGEAGTGLAGAGQRG